MESKRFTLDTTLTLIAAYLCLFAGLIRAVGQRVPCGWALTVTGDGRTALADVFGIDWSA
jgi:hypothetical protein